MAQFTFLVYKSQPQIGARNVNGVISALVNSATGPKALTNAALAANAAFASFANTDDSEADFRDNNSVLFPSNYFDTAVAVSASAGVPASGNGSVNGDAYIFQEPNTAPQYVDHSAYTPVT